MEISSYIDIYKEDKDLYPYQQKAKKDIFSAWDKMDSVMLQMPTGTGKTRLFTSIISDINKFSIRKKQAVKILIIAHRTELINQIASNLKRYKVSHNIIAGGHEKNYKFPVSVASIQTITNYANIEKAKRLKVQFVIIDEAHHALAKTYKKLWDMYPDAKRLGVTATPWRMNHQSFLDLFDDLILSMPVKDFIKQGYLSPYKYFSLRNDSDIQRTIDDIEVNSFGEYKETSMEEKMDIGSIRAQLLDSYLRLAKGKKGIIYAINIAHARHICKEYENAGFKAVSIDSKTPAAERQSLVKKFQKGEIDIIVNVDIFSEGFDCPDIEFIQMARPTLSLVKYLQQVGRGLRITENKTHCIILDNVGMYSRFGLPDARRHWRYHFLGKQVDETPSNNFSPTGTGKPRTFDLSEGTEEMLLIQETDGGHIMKESRSAIEEFFPLYGVTLGESTWQDIKDMGYKIERSERSESRFSIIGNVFFWDHDGDGIFKSIYWTKDDDEFPDIWKSKGFSWDNSYDKWIECFKSLGFNIEVKISPCQKLYRGSKRLNAEFEALSQDGALEFCMYFDYGENGCYTSSPKTLYSITVKYIGQPQVEDDTEDEIEDEETENLFYDDNGVSYKGGVDTLLKYPHQNHYDKIEIPEFIKYINSRAFKDNTTMEIILHDQLLELQDNLFEGCHNLKTITLPCETPDDILIDPDAFSGFETENCVLRVPFDALSRYFSDARFGSFKRITAIEGSRCLYYDEKGIKVISCDEEECENIVIPEGVTEISNSAFEDREDIRTVYFPESLTSIGDCAFSGCSNISSITLNESLESIGYDAFRYTGLTGVEIPAEVSNIGMSAFNCEMKVDRANIDYWDIDGVLLNFLETELIIYPPMKKGKHYDVPDSVEEIGSFAFEDSSLESISFPDTIETIGIDIFNGCENLRELVINVENPMEIKIKDEAFNGFDKKKCKLIVPRGCKANYASHKQFKGFLSIEEIGSEDGEESRVAKTQIALGRSYTTPPAPILSESKLFCQYKGSNNCYVVMTAKGFFLKILSGSYYFLSENSEGIKNCQIWIKDKRGKSTDYDVSYSVDNLNGKAFGHFYESKSKGELTFRDYKTGKSFTIDLRTRKRIN